MMIKRTIRESRVASLCLVDMFLSTPMMTLYQSQDSIGHLLLIGETARAKVDLPLTEILMLKR